MKRLGARSVGPSRVPRKPTQLAIDAGIRLKASREALELTATKFAAQIGVSRSRLANWEAGTSKVDIPVLLTLKALYGLSLDWIFAADLSTMKPELAVKILEKMPPPAPVLAPAPEPEQRDRKRG